jgi:DNA-binding LacI/PurR family transcriptional regulator
VAGEVKTTMEDLARLAGVSVSTVSRALNDAPLISARTKQRIAIVTPYVMGQPLPLSHPFFLELIAGIGEAARKRDCDFTVSHVSAASYDDLVRVTTTSRASGVIFLGQATLHASFNALADTGARFVVWGAHFPDQRYRSIGSDNFGGGRRATAHLLRLGRRRVVFLGGHDPEAMQRHRGYLDAHAELGVPVDPILLGQVEFELESAEAAISKMLGRGTAFDAVFAASDLMALGAIRALRGAGKRVPEDVSVVGYDDMLLARLSSPALTTVRQDTFEAGRLLVSSILDDVDPGRNGLIATTLIVRESCGA